MLADDSVFNRTRGALLAIKNIDKGYQIKSPQKQIEELKEKVEK